MPPIASIIIPNFENGRKSSVDGATDLLGDLLESIHETLPDDPADLEVEILIADHGSRDDSLETARAWAARSGDDGRPLCRLLEVEPGGTLSISLNRLMEASVGSIICRFDGDVRLLSRDWLQRAVGHFDRLPGLGVLGGRQLDHEGRLHSVGDLLLHPHGYQHVGAGAAPDAPASLYEHDHVMGCFHLMRRAAFDAVGPYDESMPRGQTVDLGYRLLEGGWKAMTDPDIVYEHRLALRKGRPGPHDGRDSLETSRKLFHAKWGFDRLVPDRNALRARLGTELVPPDFDSAANDPAGIDDPEHRIDNRVALIRGAVQPGKATRIMMLGGGDGSVENRLLEHRIHVTSVENREVAVDAARLKLERTGVGLVPNLVKTLESLPVEDGLVDLLVVDRLLERTSNPVALLAESARVLSPTGILLLLARWRTPEEQIEAPEAFDRVTPTSLRNLVAGTGLFLSIPFVRNPFPNPEPDVLVYALALQAQPGLGKAVFDSVGDPTLSA